MNFDLSDVSIINKTNFLFGLRNFLAFKWLGGSGQPINKVTSASSVANKSDVATEISTARACLPNSAQ